MVYVLSLFQLFAISFICYTEYKNRSLSIFIWAILLVMYGLPNITDCFVGYSDYGESVLIECNLFVIFFCIIYFITRKSVRKSRNNLTSYVLKEELSKRQIKYYFILLFIAFIIYLAYVYRSTGSILGSTWNTIRANALGEEGHVLGNGDFLYVLYTFVGPVFSAASGLLAYALCTKKTKLWITVLAIQLAYALISRSRSSLLSILIPFILFLIFSHNQLNLKIVIRIVLLGLVSVFLVYFLQIIRLAGSLEAFLDNYSIEYILSGFSNIGTNSSGDLSLRNVFYYFVEHNNDFEGFGTLASYRGLLFLPIPSSLSLGLKPADFAITMGGAWIGNPNNTTFSTHPTLFGDCYGNAGFAGIFLAIFWALFVSVVDRLVDKVHDRSDRVFYICAICCQYVLIARGSVYYSCRIMLIAVMIIWLFRHFVLRVRLRAGKKVYFDNFNNT